MSGADWRATLAEAERLEGQRRFRESIALCIDLAARVGDSAAALERIGQTLSRMGAVTAAAEVLRRAVALNPTAVAPLLTLTGICQDAMDPDGVRAALAGASVDHLDNPVFRSNLLLRGEYDLMVRDDVRVHNAMRWGLWASFRAGDSACLPRPAATPLSGRPLRVGYVSPDIRQHTVGLLAKDVLAAHDRSRVSPVVYATTEAPDWVTQAVAAHTPVHDVRRLDDDALAARIRADAIDVLVDLAGHTGGNRLTAFAWRPAPVQVSWLGYFATTGLPAMDAVLLDRWHAPPGSEALFTERIVRMPRLRLCFTPFPLTPPVGPLPALSRGTVTFGCFNNTAKLNPAVLAVWAAVLRAVPDSRLLLKWSTFHDPPLCARIRQTIADHGIAPERVEMRGHSTHARTLETYAEVDIALDPFPFTGGMTSCEALWMGVPVITLPQRRVVSRQTFAYLSAIGLGALAARTAEGYVALAAELARDLPRLAALRHSLRPRMAASPLCDVPGFTRCLEDTLCALFTEISAAETAGGASTGAS